MKTVNKNLIKGLNEVILEAYKDNEAEIVDMITEVQQWEKGQDGLGRSFGVPAPLTVTIKLGTPGLDKRVDHLTGRSTGEMHRKARFLSVDAKGVLIGSDSSTADDFVERFDRAWKVNKEHTSEIAHTMVKPAVIEYLKRNFWE